jgi:hypothetical protein
MDNFKFVDNSEHCGTGGSFTFNSALTITGGKGGTPSNVLSSPSKFKIGDKVKLNINDEFVQRKFYGRNINAFLIDNVDLLINYLACGVKVEAITFNEE